MGFRRDAEIRTLNPGTAPIWLAGLAALLAWRRFADLRFLSIAFVLLIAAMIALHGKDYYPVGAYPVLFAAGAVAVEAWIARPILRTALVAEMLAFGLVGAPFALPVLPIGRFLDYQTQLGLVPEQQERSRLGRLPQYYADMFGWRRDGGARLPGAAAAGSRPGRLPRRQLRRGRRRRRVRRTMAPAAGHQRAQQQLPLGSARPRRQRGHPSRREQEALLKVYASVEAAGVFDNPWAMPYETGRTVWICRNREPPLDEAWSSLKNYR